MPRLWIHCNSVSVLKEAVDPSFPRLIKKKQNKFVIKVTKCEPLKLNHINTALSHLETLPHDKIQMVRNTIKFKYNKQPLVLTVYYSGLCEHNTKETKKKKKW